jgi:hypothetical protein
MSARSRAESWPGVPPNPGVLHATPSDGGPHRSCRRGGCQSQKVGKVNTTVEASAETGVVCGGTRPWSVARTTSGPAYPRTAETSRSVMLVWGRK